MGWDFVSLQLHETKITGLPSLGQILPTTLWYSSGNNPGTDGFEYDCTSKYQKYISAECD